MFAAYARQLQTRPLLTKMVTSGAILGTGDGITQWCIEPEMNWRRTAKFTFMGTFLVAPVLHVWFGFLARRFADSVPKRLMMDQLVFTPIFLTGFIFTNSMLDDGNAREAWRKVEINFFPTLQSNWMVWVPYQFFNFKYVPLQFQVLANNACALFWNCYLSYKLHLQHDHSHDHVMGGQK